MTKTAMHFHGRDLQGPGSGSSMVGGSSGGSQCPSGRDIKPHQCQQCLKAFSSNHQLVQHIRVHTGEKPYKCSYCDRRFKQLSHVQQHTRLHTGERPYKCHVPDCGRAFIQLSNLQQHLRNHESQLERLKNRPFHCNICGKGFATESSLRTHNGKHTALVGGPNPTCCPLCQKLCISGEALMEHMKFVHKDPNASGVPGLLSHMDEMRMDAKHQFAAQYVLNRAANERREREALLAAAAMNMQHFAMAGGNMQPLLGSGLACSPSSQSDSSATRMSTPGEMKMEHSGLGGSRNAFGSAGSGRLAHQQGHHPDYVHSLSQGNVPGASGAQHFELGNVGLLQQSGSGTLDSFERSFVAPGGIEGNPRVQVGNPRSDPEQSTIGHRVVEQGVVGNVGESSRSLISPAVPVARASSSDSLFKPSAFGTDDGGPMAGYPPTSGYSELLSRYRLEQTLKHLHGFQDARNIGIPFSSSSATGQGPV
ncbi:hypothetical protein TCAL_06043 [Tigriopus californicus]|uniref:C2H2-type domain-containing protein n=1 Tax=Tigriopus californicus TaxID=6832 RepID=A0A553PQA8_TIGCA|nr:hypothetical protein TCAL_06043 [Tigriopus californicus]|eukprot:TCALIF_06043-PA protein Name:"Similar to ZNF384 Zinc finger protein 384 (Homo sapiens)" AED:0.49 eAED:0.49 QI:0/0/0/0.6/1/1/5/0/478